MSDEKTIRHAPPVGREHLKVYCASYIGGPRAKVAERGETFNCSACIKAVKPYPQLVNLLKTQYGVTPEAWCFDAAG